MSDDKMPELLPCPFCGPQDGYDVVVEVVAGAFQVRCDCCDVVTQKFTKQDYATQFWNTRTVSPAVPLDARELDEAPMWCFEAAMGVLGFIADGKTNPETLAELISKHYHAAALTTTPAVSDHGFTPEEIAEFEKAEDRVDAWLQTEGLEIARNAATNATTGAQTCVHCDPSFVLTGPDGWCDCSCHKPAATTSAATPSGLGSMRRERYIWDSAISTAVAEVERLVDGWKNEGRFTLCWATRKDTASEIITALRALPSEARVVNGDAREVEAAVWAATRDFKGILNELQRRRIAMDVAAAITATNKGVDQ